MRRVFPYRMDNTGAFGDLVGHAAVDEDPVAGAGGDGGAGGAGRGGGAGELGGSGWAEPAAVRVSPVAEPPVTGSRWAAEPGDRQRDHPRVVATAPPRPAAG